MVPIVQIFFRGSDDPSFDMWIDISLEALPTDDPIHETLKLFDRVGKRLVGHVLCCPNHYDMTEDELKIMRNFDPSKYKMYAPPPDRACVTKKRYVIKID